MIFYRRLAVSSPGTGQRRKHAGDPARRGPAGRRFAFSGAAAAVVAVLLGIASTAQAVTGFQAQASGNVPGSDFDQLNGVADTGFFDVAVGSYRISGQTLFHALALRFNGRTWSPVPVPVPPGDNTVLKAVTTVTPANNWAVGSDATHTLIEHQNNSSSWSLVPSPANEPANSELVAISAVSANDIWAVGDSRAGTEGQGFEPLIEHFNGSTWSVVPSAPVGTGSDFLSGVSAVSANSVWAVGRTGDHSVPLIEHFNGSSWTRVAQPVNGFDSSLNSVAAISSTDVWAVGEQNLNQTVIEHFNGTNWSVVPSPSVTANGAQDFLSSVSAIGSSDVWAVGFSGPPGSTQTTLAEHWDGTSWQIVPSANPGPASNELLSLAQTAPGGPLRAVGFSTGGTISTATLVETTAG
jgi:hypothetical protein